MAEDAAALLEQFVACRDGQRPIKPAVERGEVAAGEDVPAPVVAQRDTSLGEDLQDPLRLTFRLAFRHQPALGLAEEWLNVGQHLERLSCSLA